MKKLALNKEFALYERNGEPVCSSRQVAETFEKEHKNVLRDIAELGCSEEFSRLNFELSDYTSRGKKYPEYLLTKDGFIALAMGYTGKKAWQFKEAYIRRFNEMESFIKTLTKARLSHPAFTKAIEEAHEEPKFYHYSNEADMINKIVLGISAKTFREEVGLKTGESIRPFLGKEQVDLIDELQRADVGLLAIGMEYEERKTKLTAVAQRRIIRRYRALNGGS